MSKNILLTGVSQGLGLEIARAVLAQGWSIYGVSRRLTPEYEALMGVYPERVKFYAFDLADVDGLKTKVFKEFVGLDVPLHGLVNNAALAYDDLITNLDEARLKAMYVVNVFAPMMATRQAIRNMLLHGQGGSIVQISSVCAHTGYKGIGDVCFDEGGA